MPEPPSDPTAGDPPSSGPLGDEDAPLSSRRAVASAVDEAPPPSGVTDSRVRAALRAFLASTEQRKGRDFVRAVIVKRLGEDVDPVLADDLVQLAVSRAMDARSPPWFVASIPGWVARLTRRAIADYFRAGERDKKYLDRSKDAADTLDRHAPRPDYGARAHLVTKWLEKQIGDDPRKVATFRLMVAHEIDGYSLDELAAQNHTTVSALSNRFHKLRRELAPKVRLMDRENPRRAVFALLILLGVGALVAVVYFLWSLLVPPAPPLGVPPARPVRTLPAPAPSSTFDNALPTTPSTVRPNTADGGERKP